MSCLDEYINLPEDPELAFVEYENRLRNDMNAQIAHDNSNIYEAKRYYALQVMAFHDAWSFSFLMRPELVGVWNNFDEIFDSFQNEVLYWTTQIKIRHAHRLRAISTILCLTPDIRQQLHHYITKIRETLTPIELPENKKEVLFAKLNALADEIDRDRTKTEAWTAFTLELISVGGKAAKVLQPVKEFSDSIGNLLGKAKELSDRLGIPSPQTPKRLEAAKKQLPKPEPLPLDDEIPF